MSLNLSALPVVYSPRGGFVIDYMLGERTAYSRQTLAEVSAQYPDATVASQDDAMAAIENGRKTPARRVTVARFEELRDCLPPCRWHHVGGAEVFHVSERITGNVVTWAARVSDAECYTFDDSATLTDAELRARIDAGRMLPPLATND